MLYFLQNFEIIPFIAFLVVAVLAFAYHEFGHAIVADRLGDMTPRRYGRITLNPFPHLSLMGMVMLVIFGFGWAVTPINPSQLRGNPRTSHALVAIAGPASNFIMAALFAIPLRLTLGGYSILISDMPSWLSQFLFVFLNIGVRLNLFLIAFNLLPIPPLDGFWVLRGVLPVDLAYRLDGLQQYGTMIFIVVVFLLPYIDISIFPAMNEFASVMYNLLVNWSPL
ncbi:MAG: site-2 protease family protein [Candidatus Promineifilaceae bacterium]